MKCFSAVLSLALTTLLASPSASAVTFKVNVTQDLPDISPGDGICSVDPFLDPETFAVCSLRAAVMEGNATPADQSVTVRLMPAATYILNTPELQPQGAIAGDLDITRPMTIGVPENSAARAKIDANQISRAFELHGDAADTRLYGLEITGGYEPVDNGVAIHSLASSARFEFLDVHDNMGPINGLSCAVEGSIQLLESRVHHNGTDESSTSGICNTNGPLTITRSTIDSNSMYGIFLSHGILWLDSSTVTDSDVTGVWLRNVDATIASSTISANGYTNLHLWAENEEVHLNLTGSIINNDDQSEACNFYESGPGKIAAQMPWNIYSDATCLIDAVSDNSIHNATINLSELSDWGGPTPTMIPLPGSDAIDRAPAIICSGLDVDQRGLPRPVASVEGEMPRCDIGAVELTTILDEDLPPGGVFVDGFEGL